MPLGPGDEAPDWTLRGVVHGALGDVVLATLRENHRAVVLHTYPLDFTGG